MTRWRWIVPLAWALTIAYLSATPLKELPTLHINWEDKIGHFAVYGLLTLLIMWAWNSGQDFFLKKIVTSVALAGLYGMAMECMQGTFFPGRVFDVFDMLANFIGAMMAGSVGWAWENSQKTKKQG